jgi:hypothetical protein
VQLFEEWKWTILKTLSTLVFSNLGTGLIHILSDWSLFLKYTNNVGSTVTKVAVFQLMNSFLVPFLAFFFDFSSRKEGIPHRQEMVEPPQAAWCSPLHSGS